MIEDRELHELRCVAVPPVATDARQLRLEMLFEVVIGLQRVHEISTLAVEDRRLIRRLVQAFVEQLRRFERRERQARQRAARSFLLCRPVGW
jgi:hypothetical protein